MYLKDSKIIVVKIGSSLIVDQNKKIRKQWLSSFAKDIKKLRDKNQKVVIVSSGAIALGCKKMNYNKKNIKLDKSQAIASIGQIELMNLFSQTFSKYKLNISQILLTLEDTEERRRSSLEPFFLHQSTFQHEEQLAAQEISLFAYQLIFLD